MPIIVGNDTYVRKIYDPDDLEVVLKVDGKVAKDDKLAALAAAAEKEGRELDIDISQRVKDDAKAISVTYRTLRAADKTAIEDTVQMQYGSGVGQMAPGSMRRLAIQRAVVKWDHEVAFSENVLDNLDATVFEQLYAWVSWGAEPPQQDEETGGPLDSAPVTNRAQRRAATKRPKKAELTPEPES